MSGHKVATITISQEEYRRLYELEKSLQYEAESHPAIEDPTAVRQLEETILAEHTQNQNDYLEMVSRVNNEVADLQARVIQTNLDLEEQYVSAMFRERNQFEVQFSAARQEYDQNLARAHHRIDSLSARIEAQADLIETLMTRGRDYEQAFSSLLDLIGSCAEFIQDHYPAHLYPVDEVDKELRKAGIAEKNWNEGLYEAALSQAQVIYVDLDDLRTRTGHRHLEWVVQYNQMVEGVKALGEDLTRSEHIQPIDSDGNLLDDAVPLDYWTRGQYNDLCQRFNGLIETINENEMELSSAVISSEIAPLVKEIGSSLSDMITNARLAIISSQRRYELANRILAALVEQGYIPVAGNYRQGEFLDGYTALVRSHDGSEISVTIDPDEAATLNNKLHVLSSDADRLTEHELQERAKEIRESLSGTSYSVSPLVQTLDVKKPVKLPRRSSRS